MSDGADPTAPPPTEPPNGRPGPRLSNVTLSDQERLVLIDSIDEQLAELDRRIGAKAGVPPVD